MSLCFVSTILSLWVFDSVVFAVISGVGEWGFISYRPFKWMIQSPEVHKNSPNSAEWCTRQKFHFLNLPMKICNDHTGFLDHIFILYINFWVLVCLFPFSKLDFYSAKSHLYVLVWQGKGKHMKENISDLRYSIRRILCSVIQLDTIIGMALELWIFYFDIEGLQRLMVVYKTTQWVFSNRIVTIPLKGWRSRLTT